MADSVDSCVGDFTSRYPQIDPDVEGVVDRISAIEKHLGRAFAETLDKHGLSYGEYRLLLRLATRSSEHRISAGELSRSLQLSSGAMTARLDKMEAAGLICRLADPRDRRAVLVELTEVGAKTIDSAVIEQSAKEIDELSALSAKERAQLNQLLRKLLVSLEDDTRSTAT